MVLFHAFVRLCTTNVKHTELASYLASVLAYILTEIYFLFSQAALGPIALDMARQLDSEEHIAYANIILVISVLAIIFTAPLEAILMTKLAPSSWL